MPFPDYLILVQNVFLMVLITCPGWMLCGKKKTPKAKSIRPPADTAKSAPISTIKQDSADLPPTNEKAAEKKGEEPPKEEQKKESAEGEKKDGKSQKEFPKFEMPTESKRKAKIQENEKDKKEKMQKGFFQEKSDEDDTLEKIDSLRVEQSDKTKRSAKNKKK